jgi:hypothetical protein
MEALRPDTVNIMILSKHYAAENICNETEPWFKTQYTVKGKFSVPIFEGNLHKFKIIN